MHTKKRGRPSGKIKTAKIEISIEPYIKDDFMQILQNENLHASVLIRDWIIEYIKDQK